MPEAAGGVSVAANGTVRNLGLADVNIRGSAAPLYDAMRAVTLTRGPSPSQAA